MTPVVRRCAAAVAAAVAASGAWAIPTVAGSDIAHVRDRAEAVAHRVSALEARLASLERRRSRIDDRVSAASLRLDVERRELHTARAVVERAGAEVERVAIELYKGGTMSQLDVVMAESNLSDAYTAAQIASLLAERNAITMTGYVRARTTFERVRASLGRTLRRLESERARIAVLARQTERALGERRRVLRSLRGRIAELQRVPEQVPAQGPALPGGFIRTGVVVEGLASWYGSEFGGRRTASGERFDPDGYTAASKTLPLGTWLNVVRGERAVIVRVNDRGPYERGRILDLSRAAAEAIGIGGVARVTAEVLVRR